MEFRKRDLELMITCTLNECCTNCPLRIGCPIRHDFYQGEIQLEISIQRAELMLHPIIGEERALNASNLFRKKIQIEKGLYPGGYSYV